MSHFKCGMWNSESGLIDTYQPACHFQTTWYGTDEHSLPVAAGVYFCQLECLRKAHQMNEPMNDKYDDQK